MMMMMMYIIMLNVDNERDVSNDDGHDNDVDFSVSPVHDCLSSGLLVQRMALVVKDLKSRGQNYCLSKVCNQEV